MLNSHGDSLKIMSGLTTLLPSSSLEQTINKTGGNRGSLPQISRLSDATSGSLVVLDSNQKLNNKKAMLIPYYNDNFASGPAAISM